MRVASSRLLLTFYRRCFSSFYALGSNGLYNFLRAPRTFRRLILLRARPILVYVRERGNALSLPNLSAATPTSSWREVVRGRPARRSNERRLRSINESRRPNIAFGFTAKPHGNELNTTKSGDSKQQQNKKNTLRMRAFGAVFCFMFIILPFVFAPSHVREFPEAARAEGYL